MKATPAAAKSPAWNLRGPSLVAVAAVVTRRNRWDLESDRRTSAGATPWSSRRSSRCHRPQPERQPARSRRKDQPRATTYCTCFRRRSSRRRPKPQPEDQLLYRGRKAPASRSKPPHPRWPANHAGADAASTRRRPEGRYSARRCRPRLETVGLTQKPRSTRTKTPNQAKNRVPRHLPAPKRRPEAKGNTGLAGWDEETRDALEDERKAPLVTYFERSYYFYYYLLHQYFRTMVLNFNSWFCAWKSIYIYVLYKCQTWFLISNFLNCSFTISYPHTT